MCQLTCAWCGSEIPVGHCIAMNGGEVMHPACADDCNKELQMTVEPIDYDSEYLPGIDGPKVPNNTDIDDSYLEMEYDQELMYDLVLERQEMEDFERSDEYYGYYGE